MTLKDKATGEVKHVKAVRLFSSLVAHFELSSPLPSSPLSMLFPSAYSIMVALLRFRVPLSTSHYCILTTASRP